LGASVSTAACAQWVFGTGFSFFERAVGPTAVHDAIREWNMKFTVTSWVGGIEVVDRPASAWAALELVLALLGHKRTDVRIFDQNGRRRTPAELCLLASKEVAMLPDESELSF